MTTQIERALRTAKTALRAGNPLAASHAILPEIKRFPDNARLLAALAEVQAARTGLPARPFGAAHIQRLLRLRAQAGANAVAEEVQVALLLDPQSVLANSYFGSLCLELGAPEAAIAPLRLALKRAPNSPEVGTNLAFALRKAGQGGEAVAIARATLAHHPDLQIAKVALGLALVEDGLARQGADVFAGLVKANPGSADMLYELGRAHYMAQNFDAALAAFEGAVARDPNHLNALNELGSMMLTSGAFDRAKSVFDATIAAHPQAAAAYYNLSRAVDALPGDPIIARMQKLESAAKPADKILLNFGLAKLFEDIGQVDESFAAIKRANDLRRIEFPFDLAVEQQFFDALKASHWAPDATLTDLTPPTRRPIFILGMMRSGTTLMEQILSAHSQVYGAGELGFLGRAVLAEMHKDAGPLDRAAMARIRDNYLTRINDLPGTAPFIIDKMPSNFAMVGVILRALPEARIIHMQRDPIAVCWSIYQKNFSGSRLRFTNDLGDIAAYYDLYTDYMAFAEAQAPGVMLHMPYADLTKTPEPMIRRALEFCGLPFEPACLAPEKNSRVVQTASYKQARSGIYTGSTSKWRGFEPYLKPLTDHFGS